MIDYSSYNAFRTALVTCGVIVGFVILIGLLYLLVEKHWIKFRKNNNANSQQPLLQYDDLTVQQLTQRVQLIELKLAGGN